MLASVATVPRLVDRCKMDDAAWSIRQYVAALSRVLSEFVECETGRCDESRVDNGSIWPLRGTFCKPLTNYF